MPRAFCWREPRPRIAVERNLNLVTGHDAAYWQILLQKSQNAVRLIFRKKTKQAAIVDRDLIRKSEQVRVWTRTGPGHNGFSLAATFEGEFSNVTRSCAGKGIVHYSW